MLSRDPKTLSLACRMQIVILVGKLKCWRPFFFFFYSPNVNVESAAGIF